jgi:hypothetical protein
MEIRIAGVDAVVAGIPRAWRVRAFTARASQSASYIAQSRQRQEPVLGLIVARLEADRGVSRLLCKRPGFVFGLGETTIAPALPLLGQVATHFPSRISLTSGRGRFAPLQHFSAARLCKRCTLEWTASDVAMREMVERSLFSAAVNHRAFSGQASGSVHSELDDLLPLWAESPAGGVVQYCLWKTFSGIFATMPGPLFRLRPHGSVRVLVRTRETLLQQPPRVPAQPRLDALWTWH